MCWALSICLLGQVVLAQPFPSKDGKFVVDEISGCAPFDITITIDPVYVCGACDVDLDGAGSEYSYQSTNQSQTFTYTSPGTYWLKVLIGTTDTDSIQVNVVENKPADFHIYSCGNNEIAVTLKESTYDQYIIDYNDGSPEVTVSPMGTDRHVYASGTPQTIAVRGKNVPASDNCDAESVIVTPRLSLPAPTITRLDVIDDARVRLEYDTEPFIQYRLVIATNNTTTFQQLKTVYNTDVDTIFQLRTQNNYYCFRLEAYDPCNNTTQTSPLICSPRFTVEAINNAINTNWLTGTGVSGYTLTRRAQDGSTLSENPSTSPFTDITVDCGQEYCYQLTVAWPNGSHSYSQEVCATGFSTDIPPAITDITTVVDDNTVTMEWQYDPTVTPVFFTVEKSSGNSTTELGTTPELFFTDNDYNAEVGACYRITYEDACSNLSPASLDACPVQLTGHLRQDNTITLNWTSYEGWSAGVSSYTLEKYDLNGGLVDQIEMGSATSYLDESSATDQQLSVYRIRANPSTSGLNPSTSNSLSILRNPNIFYPTAFTPNSDDLNDHFRVFGQYVAGFELMIFNRWGELLFTTTDMESGWDGTYKGQEMPEGTYSFVAHITDSAGRTFKRSGSVLLLRKSR